MLKDIEIMKQVEKIKMNCFMNACDTAKPFGSADSAFIQDPKVKRRLNWVRVVDKKVK